MNRYQGHPDQHFGYVTFAQHGDDLMILNLFKLMGIEKPSYLDLGAHHPYIISNTALLYERGSRGVNVEANPALIPEFEMARPEDKTINVGIGPEAGELKFYKYHDRSGRNTFSKEEVASLEGVMTVREEIVLPVITLKELIKTHCKGLFPDLLSCDIEGFDYDVLSQLPRWDSVIMGSTPKVIVVETRKHESAKMQSLIVGKGYGLYCRMGENLFFVRQDYLSRVY